MAYNSYYPQYPQSNAFVPQTQQPNNQIIQTNGFIPVPNEEVAKNYPVAPGNSVSFRNENAPYVYTKTMGFSQFDQPIFKRYKLIEEDTSPKEQSKAAGVDLESEIKKVWDEINVLKKTMAEIKERDNDDGV